MKACAFCGVQGPLTGEHVFGDWLTTIGLNLEPVVQEAGPLNRIGRDLGTTPPFRQKVRDVCGECNHGWMSRLEGVAKRVLTPLILGDLAQVEPSDQGAIAAWLQKTALVAMLVSSGEARAQGYGLPRSEYRNLHARRDSAEPLPATHVWIGNYEGHRRTGSVWVTPLVVAVDGVREPDWPQAYLMTVGLGCLLLQGVRFTTSALELDVAPQRALARIWPRTDAAVRAEGSPLDDHELLAFTSGRDISVELPHTSLRPWKPATELARSRAVGQMVELPTICGEHVVYYPSLLAQEALRGHFVAFITSCECGTAYIIQSEADGAHCKEADSSDVIQALYDALPGDEYLIEDESGQFLCKRLTSESADAGGG
jgi:hypothetical protein